MQYTVVYRDAPNEPSRAVVVKAKNREAAVAQFVADGHIVVEVIQGDAYDEAHRAKLGDIGKG